MSYCLIDTRTYFIRDYIRGFTLHATWQISPFEDGVACPQHTIDHMKVSRVDLCYHFSDETGPLVRKIFSTYYTNGIAELQGKMIKKKVSIYDIKKAMTKVLVLNTVPISSTWQNYLHNRLAPRNILR
mgnify:CR=1 FL=1